MMGRIIMYGIILALGIFVLTATLLIESGGKSTATVITVTVSELLTNPDRYADQEFTARGILEVDEETDEYILADSVARIRVVYPPADIDALVGDEVRVTGRVVFDEQGVYIQADRVRPVELS